MSGTQIPPQIMQQMMQQQGGQPAPQGGPLQQQSQFGGSQPAYTPPPAPSRGVPPPSGAPNKNLEAFGRAAAAKGGEPKNGKLRLTPAELAAMGRYGDTLLAHLTPGELMIPPEVQTPEVKQAAAEAFGQVGASPEQFTAGSEQSSINPQSGLPEYSLWSAILPVLGAVAGSFIPGVGTAVGMGLGGAAGGLGGSLMDGQKPGAALLSALGGGLGGYVGGGGLGNLFGGAADAAASAATSAAEAAPAAAATNAPFGATQLPPGTFPPMAASELAMPAGAPVVDAGAFDVAKAPSFIDSLKSAPWKGAMLAGLGSGVGSAFAPVPQGSANLPNGMTRPMNPLNRNYNQILGNSNNPYPTYTGYDPYASASQRVFDFYAPKVG